MEIRLDGAGKRFRFEWIFRHLSTRFEAGGRYAILGPNGAGKSTLMKVLSGHLSPSAGQVDFWADGQKIHKDDVYKQVSYAAPYIDLIEEFTLMEAIAFHRRFKPLLPGLDADGLVALLGFAKNRDKAIRFFSSGMKQRLKLALALCSEASLLLLDEPSSNLDAQGMDWYQRLLEDYAGGRTLIVASNVPADYAACEAHINILDYKARR